MDNPSVAQLVAQGALTTEVAGSTPAGGTLAECAKHGLVVHHVRGDNGRLRCGKCVADSVKRHQRRTKDILISEAGGACARCGYDKCRAALHFHHLDPATKAFQVGNGNRSLARQREEAKKCQLLCANCHAEMHYTD